MISSIKNGKMERIDTIPETISWLRNVEPDTKVSLKSTLEGPRYAGIKDFIEETAIISDITCQIAERKGLLSTSCMYRLSGNAGGVLRAFRIIQAGILSW